MICYGWRSFKDFEVVYHCEYLPNGKFMTWEVSAILEEFEDSFPEKELRFNECLKRKLLL